MGIFDADDDDATMSLKIDEMALSQRIVAAPEAEGRGVAACPPDSSKRLREEYEHQSTKQKKTRREKLRREALKNRFMRLSALLDPTTVGPLTTDNVTVVTEAARVIKQLRAELSKLSAMIGSVQESNLALEKETSCVAADKAALHQDKAKLQHQLYYTMSSMHFASPRLVWRSLRFMEPATHREAQSPWMRSRMKMQSSWRQTSWRQGQLCLSFGAIPCSSCRAQQQRRMRSCGLQWHNSH